MSVSLCFQCLLVVSMSESLDSSVSKTTGMNLGNPAVIVDSFIRHSSSHWAGMRSSDGSETMSVVCLSPSISKCFSIWSCIVFYDSRFSPTTMAVTVSIYINRRSLSCSVGHRFVERAIPMIMCSNYCGGAPKSVIESPL